MKQFYCKKCNGVLPKGDSTCDKCGHFNEALYPEIENGRKRRKVIVILSVLLGLIIVVIICNAAMLFPWQYRARHNRNAIIEYAEKNYPGAEIVEELYPTMKFNPTGNPYDVIWFELNGIEFYIEARDGEVKRQNDGYGIAKIKKEVREKYLQDFFSRKGLSCEPDISFSYDDYYWPTSNASLNTFLGSIHLDFVLGYDESKKFPEDYGWFYDFYCYWKEVCPTKDFSLRFCFRINKNTPFQLWCDSSSKFTGEDDFYKSFK